VLLDCLRSWAGYGKTCFEKEKIDVLLGVGWESVFCFLVITVCGIAFFGKHLVGKE